MYCDWHFMLTIGNGHLSLEFFFKLLNKRLFYRHDRMDTFLSGREGGGEFFYLERNRFLCSVSTCQLFSPRPVRMGWWKKPCFCGVGRSPYLCNQGPGLLTPQIRKAVGCCKGGSAALPLSLEKSQPLRMQGSRRGAGAGGNRVVVTPPSSPPLMHTHQTSPPPIFPTGPWLLFWGEIFLHRASKPICPLAPALSTHLQ